MDCRLRAVGTTADIHNRTLKAKEREFKAFLDLLMKAYPRVIMLLRRRREGTRTVSTDPDAAGSLHTSCVGGGGECHGDDYNGDDRGDDNGHSAGQLPIETTELPALVSAMSQRLSAAKGDIQRYVAEVQHDEGRCRELGSRLFRAANDGSGVITVNALFGLIPLLLDRVDSSDIVEGQGRNESGDVPSEGHTASVFPAATTWPPTVPPTMLDAKVCASSLGFRSSIFPIWNGGRWQVAILQPAGARFLIDPWGLCGSRDLHVRKTSWSAF